MGKKNLSFQPKRVALLFVLLFYLCCIPMSLASASKQGYIVSSPEGNHISMGDAISIALRCTAAQTTEIPTNELSPEPLSPGYYSVYCTYIGLPKENEGFQYAWFIAIFDCTNSSIYERSRDDIVGAVLIDAMSGKVLRAEYSNGTELTFDTSGFSALLIADDDPYGIERMEALWVPPAAFFRRELPSPYDIPRNVAEEIALREISIQECSSVTEVSDHYHFTSTLFSIPALTEERIWYISVFDDSSAFPSSPKYLVGVYASHGSLWFLCELDLQTSPYPIVVLADNRFVITERLLAVEICEANMGSFVLPRLLRDAILWTN